MGGERREDAQLPADEAAGSFCWSPACRVDRGGLSMVKCGVCPIYDLCLLMRLPRLETSGEQAPPDHISRYSHSSPGHLRAARKRAGAERRLPMHGGITSRLTRFRRLACAR
jgi:hypothetical protein